MKTKPTNITCDLSNGKRRWSKPYTRKEAALTLREWRSFRAFFSAKRHLRTIIFRHSDRVEYIFVLAGNSVPNVAGVFTIHR